MFKFKQMDLGAQSDPQLVSESLGGNREAFGQIVTRYQSLICSLAYSATGSLCQSEDLAQETFVTAWQQLTRLRDPGKLRAWLCGIARNLIHSELRHQGHEPTASADLLENAPEPAGLEPLPVEQAISREEEAILWRSLERIPEAYREPLILFYREHQSVNRVAEALELTEEAVKQRLSRGRRMLQDEVAALVEGALQRSTPGKVFTMGVLAALPIMTTSASAATLGAAAAKGTALAKGSALLGWLGAILGPVLGILGGYLGYRISLDSAQSDAERNFLKKYYRVLMFCIAGFLLLMLPLALASAFVVHSHPVLFVLLILGLSVAYTAIIITFSLWGRRKYRLLVAQTSKAMPEKLERPFWEYRSQWSLFGWPLVHIRMGGCLAERRKPVRAWIAAGDTAIGLLFAFGGLAFAPISMGGFALGLFAIGGFAVGGLAFGGFGLGVWAVAGYALGWQAFGGCALAWNAAVGGLGIARDFALGGAAYASHANDETATQFMRSNAFFTCADASMRYIYWLNLVWLIPLLAWWRMAWKARNKR